jgi:hypothetical protein
MQIEWVFSAQHVALLGYRDRKLPPFHDGSSLMYNAPLNLPILKMLTYRYQVNVSCCGYLIFFSLATPGRLGNDDVGCDDENITYLKQLSREVTALEMLKHELLERNGRLERWHAEHPRPVPASQAGVSTDSSVQVHAPFLSTLLQSRLCAHNAFLQTHSRPVQRCALRA